MMGIGLACSCQQCRRGSTDDPTRDAARPRQFDHAVVEMLVEQIGQRLAHAAGGEVAVDVGIEVGEILGGEHDDTVLQGDPPQMAGEVDDLGAGCLGNFDVPGLRHPGQLGHDSVGMLDVLEHVRADGVVEHSVGERHVGRIGVEQRAIHPRARRAGPLPAVLVAGKAIEQHVGAPVRLVAAADIEDQRVAIDRDRDAAPMERPHSPSEAHVVHRWNSRTRPFW